MFFILDTLPSGLRIIFFLMILFFMSLMAVGTGGNTVFIFQSVIGEPNVPLFKYH